MRLSQSTIAALIAASLMIVPAGAADEPETVDARVDAEETRPAPPQVGEPAPPLSISEYLQAPDDADASWEALAGKVVIVEFWTTWCGPCIAAIPHLNKLADQFEDEPVQFIAISNEDRKPVARFLERREMKAWVVLDHENQTWHDYAIAGIPQTVIVDPEGVIAGITHPNMLQAEHIEQVLAGDEPDLPDRTSPGVITAVAGIDPHDESDEPPLFQVLIRETDAPGGVSSFSNHAATMRGIGATGIIRSVYQVSSSRIEIVAGLDEQARYTLVARVPRERPDELYPLLQRAVEVTFGITAQRENRRVPSLVLRLPEGDEHKLEEAIEGGGVSMSTAAGTMAMTGMELTALANTLENVIGMPVFDETGIEGRFDVFLEFEPEIWQWDKKQRRKALIRAVREQLGLEMREVEREIEMLVIRNADEEA